MVIAYVNMWIDHFVDIVTVASWWRWQLRRCNVLHILISLIKEDEKSWNSFLSPRRWDRRHSRCTTNVYDKRVDDDSNHLNRNSNICYYFYNHFSYFSLVITTLSRWRILFSSFIALIGWHRWVRDDAWRIYSCVDCGCVHLVHRISTFLRFHYFTYYESLFIVMVMATNHGLD